MRMSILTLLLSMTVVYGCDDSVLPLADTAPCVCSDEGSGCGDDWCTYELALEPSCIGQVEFAEVLIDGHLEGELLTFEAGDGGLVPTLMTPCTRTEPGAKTRIDVFAGKWAWSRTGNTCEVPGQTKSILFGCVSQ